MKSKQRIEARFAEAPPLKQLAHDRTFARALDPDNPGGMGGSIMGRYPRIMTPTTKAALWGGADRVTVSLLKTDVIDRRYIDRDHFDLNDLLEGAYSETNKDLNDMPMAGMTRPSFSALTKEGGRYNHALWSEVYPFPCQKSVGQIIVQAPELAGAPQPQAVQRMRDGVTEIASASRGHRLTVRIAMGMARNVIAIQLDYQNLSSLSLRLYRNLDQGHRRYQDADGQYRRVVVGQPADVDKPLAYYDFLPDEPLNREFEPPTCGQSGDRFFLHQVFPGERTFPDGFRYVMMGAASGAVIVAHELAHGLGSMPRIRRDNQGMLVVPNIRTMTHPEMFEIMAQNYEYVSGAPGVAIDAKLPAGTGTATVYIAIATLNEAQDYMGRAEALLDEAQAMGFDAIAAENQAWYDALYARREQGRMLVGTTDAEREQAQSLLLDEVYQSWTSGHMGYCNPDPRRLEGSASYACYDVDTQSWHSLPCYNELFTEGTYFTRNQSEPKRLWPNLIQCWHDTLKERARLKFGLPGMCMAHGYLPAAAQSPWYVENGVLDFCMEVPGQIMKVIWNFWDYEGDEAYLRDVAYPILRDLAIFYEAFARRGWDGKVFNLEPTVETESYGISYRCAYTRNATGSLAMFRWTLHAACAAAQMLGTDADLIQGWREVAGNLAPYPTFRVGSGDVIGGNEQAFPRFTRGDHFMFTGYYPVNLADEIHLDSPQSEKDLMTRTADVLGGARNWEPYILTGASGGEIPRKYAYGAQPITGTAALTQELIEAPERLLNSRSGRIHLFPAVPAWTEAAFRGFLARGGFEVSAARDASGVKAITVKARRDSVCRLMNPWPGHAVRIEDVHSRESTAFVIDQANGECLVFTAKAGHEYSIDQA